MSETKKTGRPSIREITITRPIRFTPEVYHSLCEFSHYSQDSINKIMNDAIIQYLNCHENLREKKETK